MYIQHYPLTAHSDDVLFDFFVRQCNSSRMHYLNPRLLWHKPSSPSVQYRLKLRPVCLYEIPSLSWHSISVIFPCLTASNNVLRLSSLLLIIKKSPMTNHLPVLLEQGYGDKLFTVGTFSFWFQWDIFALASQYNKIFRKNTRLYM